MDDGIVKEIFRYKKARGRSGRLNASGLCAIYRNISPERTDFFFTRTVIWYIFSSSFSSPEWTERSPLDYPAKTNPHMYN